MTNTIGTKLKQLREGRKLTQQQLADRLNINRATISNYEVGRRSPHLPDLTMFATFFGVGLDYFGENSKDEVFELLSRARDLFDNPAISDDDKEKLYRELMRLYLNINKN